MRLASESPKFAKILSLGESDFWKWPLPLYIGGHSWNPNRHITSGTNLNRISLFIQRPRSHWQLKRRNGPLPKVTTLGIHWVTALRTSDLRTRKFKSSVYPDIHPTSDASTTDIGKFKKMITFLSQHESFGKSLRILYFGWLQKLRVTKKNNRKRTYPDPHSG